jgi:hypothetical protein
VTLKKLLFPLMACLIAGGCGKNPLLKALVSDYCPLKVGNSWNYLSLDGQKSRQVSVVGTGIYGGAAAFQLTNVDVNMGPGPGTYSYFVVRTSRSLVASDPASGVCILRQLPYLVGNRWDLPCPTGLNSISRIMYVDFREQAVEVPAGTFRNCIRLRDTAVVVDAQGNTSDSTTYIWVAPDVGEIKTGSLNTTGVTTTILELTSYQVLR